MNPLLIAALAYAAREARGCLRDLSRGLMLVRAIRALDKAGGGHLVERRRGCEIQVTVYRSQLSCRRGRGAGLGPGHARRPARNTAPACRQPASRGRVRGRRG